MSSAGSCTWCQAQQVADLVLDDPLDHRPAVRLGQLPGQLGSVEHDVAGHVDRLLAVRERRAPTQAGHGTGQVGCLGAGRTRRSRAGAHWPG